MPTYQGRTLRTMPPLPGPKSILWKQSSLVGVSTSPFTGAEQVLDWNASFLTASLTLPPLGDEATATAWTTFLFACKGKSSAFALPAGWAAFAAPVASSGYFSLASNDAEYSVSSAKLYGITFDIREVVAVS